MIKNGFYYINEILSKKDINGERPVLFMVESNRGVGKTYSTRCMLLKRFINKGSKFIYLVRYKTQIPGVADSFMKGINVKFTGKMTEKLRNDKRFSELFYNKKSCGYVLAISQYRYYKEISTTFVDADIMLLDEMEADTYITEEYRKFMSILISVSRGASNSTYRYVPCILLSNAISVVNPYFIGSGIYKYINRAPSEAIYIRGDKCVLEKVHNKQAAEVLDKNLGALLPENERRSSIRNEYLLDDCYLVKEHRGRKYLIFNISYEGELYGFYKTGGCSGYISSSTDRKFNICYAVRDNDRTEKAPTVIPQAMKRYLKEVYNTGYIEFENYLCREAFLGLIGQLKYNNRA